MKGIALILLFSLNILCGQWSQLNSPDGQSISGLIADEENLIAVTAFTEFYSSGDNGVNWQALPSNNNLLPYGLDLFHKMGDYLFVSQNVFSDTVNYRLQISSGIWEALPYQSSILMEFISKGNQIFTVIQGGIARSIDFGNTFHLLNQPPIEGYIKLLYADDDYLYAYHGCNLYRTADNGDPWEEITGNLDEIGPQDPYSCTHFSDMETWNDKLVISIYWYGGVGTLFTSSNHGDSWNLIETFPSQLNATVGHNSVSELLVKNSVLYAGTATSEDGLYYTHDLISWHDYSSGLPWYDMSISQLIATDDFLYTTGSNAHQAVLIENEIVSGDINADGSIDILDVVNLVSFILGTDSPTDIELFAADQNNDGILDVIDIVILVDGILSTS